MDFILDRDEDAPLSSRYPPIDFRAALNDEQYAAVTAPPGPLLVLAGAGSGKTRTLTYRVAWLLHQGVPPGEIMLLTFTNKASKEMLHRVNDLTGEDPRRFWGGTFHSLGNRALRMFGDSETMKLAKNFTILDAGESELLLKRTVESDDKLFFKDKTNPARVRSSTSSPFPVTPRNHSLKPSTSTSPNTPTSPSLCPLLPKSTRRKNVNKTSSTTTIYSNSGSSSSPQTNK